MKILVIDDEKNIRRILKFMISEMGHTFVGAADPEIAEKILKNNDVDLIILDIKMPKIDGIDYLKKLNSRDINIPVLMLTAHGNVELAVKSMKLGAHDFMEKDGDEEYIKKKINSVLENINEKRSYQKNNLIVKDDTMIKLINEVNKIVNKDINILIKGESGVGKEEIAKYIYLNSDTAKSFLPVNCGAIPESLFESEMFGYKKGAFTDAKDNHKGIFERANNGILFLDEICELSLKNQASLLRVLENKKFYPIGATKKIKSNFRLLSATNRDIENQINNGLFRKDLFFRINAYEIDIPPLRDREDDIMPLAYYFIKRFEEKYNLEYKVIHDDLKEFLKNNHWKGNVRELKNFIEKLLILSNSKYLYYNSEVLEDINIDLEKILEDDEKNIINKVYKITNGNIDKMVKILNIEKGIIKERLMKYEII